MATITIPPRRIEEFFKKDGTFTLRALRFFEELTDISNDTSITIEDLEENQVILEAKAITQAAMFNQQRQHDSADNRIETLEVAPKASQSSIVKQQQETVLLDDRVEALESITHVSPTAISKQQQQTDALDERVETVEIDLSSRPRMADVYKVNQRVNELIDELIAEIRAIAPNTELEHKAHCVQVETLQQLKLLNMRNEEILETDLDESDL